MFKILRAAFSRKFFTFDDSLQQLETWMECILWLQESQDSFGRKARGAQRVLKLNFEIVSRIGINKSSPFLRICFVPFSGVKGIFFLSIKYCPKNEKNNVLDLDFSAMRAGIYVRFLKDE